MIIIFNQNLSSPILQEDFVLMAGWLAEASAPRNKKDELILLFVPG
jgi:hypothetical protein